MAIRDKLTPSTTSTSSTTFCSSFTLPSDGIINFGNDFLITLTSDAIYQQLCNGTVGLEKADISSPSSVSDLRDPFYESTLPQCFALAATTVIAYMLVIMLFITPRTFLSGGTVILGRRGFTNGNGGSGGVGIGGRPWLQKVAALTVAVSLTIATVDTFRVGEEQYENGNLDAKALQRAVLNSNELKAIRVISDTFLWLAQAQTLIRLFPRHREKIIIKWTAFALILLDTIFSVLNNFVYGSNNMRPRTFEDAIPALSYLFQLALGLLYCAWVIYYAITKKNYAFYHQYMRNICLVAFLSIIAVIVPVVFFVLDISRPTLAGWGDYVRWVGAAAASVVVWEWVERIEALERNDKKDGILGREVFDGDEMLEVTPSIDTLVNRNRRGDEGGENGDVSLGTTRTSWPVIASQYTLRQSIVEGVEPRHNQGRNRILGRQTEVSHPTGWPSRPPPVATPISRTDTASAESTVYAIRYHPISDSRGPTDESTLPSIQTRSGSVDIEVQNADDAIPTVGLGKEIVVETAGDYQPTSQQRPNVWESIHLANPFRKRDEALSGKISTHASKTANSSNLDPNSQPSKWDIVARLEDFAAVQADKLRDKTLSTHHLPPLTVTRIPAPRRTRTLQEIAEELADEDAARLRPIINGTRDTTPGSPRTLNSGGGPSSFSRDPYTPAVIDDAEVTHRGSLSFAASLQRDMDRRMNDGVNRSLPFDDDQDSSPRTPASRDRTRSSSLHSELKH